MDVGQHVDHTALSELQIVMGDEFPLLIETFINDCMHRIEAASQAIAAANSDALRREAHSFKGSAGNMGAVQLTELCRVMEQLGYSGETDGAEELLVRIKAESQHVSRALKSL